MHVRVLARVRSERRSSSLRDGASHSNGIKLNPHECEGGEWALSLLVFDGGIDTIAEPGHELHITFARV